MKSQSCNKPLRKRSTWFSSQKASKKRSRHKSIRSNTNSELSRTITSLKRITKLLSTTKIHSLMIRFNLLKNNSISRFSKQEDFKRKSINAETNWYPPSKLSMLPESKMTCWWIQFLKFLEKSLIVKNSTPKIRIKSKL